MRSKICFALLCLFLLYPAAVTAATFSVPCSGTITSTLQSAINSAADGDTVEIGAGTCSAGQVSWTNKNIVVKGQGMGVTTVNGLAFNVVDTTKGSFRISGMSVGAPQSWLINAVERTTGIKGWRIDHVEWTYPGCTQNIAISINGINWGLIDSNKFTNAGNAIFIRAWAENTNEVNPWPPSGNPGMGGYGWLLPINFGTDEAVYVEDNTFTMANGCYYGIGDMYYGGRTVFRYNNVTNLYWQNHAARSHERGGNLKAEIYGNDFNALDTAWYRAIHMRSGTGVIFNNTIRGAFNTIQVDNQRSNGQNTGTPFGACAGSSAWDGNAAGQAGWPCLDQIGRGPGQYPNQPSVPLYVWNNGQSAGCSRGGTCTNPLNMVGDGDAHVQEGRDYFNGVPKPGYTPYAYPHPLRTGEVVTPPTPTDISFSSNTPSGSSVTINAGTSQSFSFILSNPSSLPTGASWSLNGVNQTGAFNQNTFTPSNLVAGNYTVLLRVSSSRNTLTRTWTLIVLPAAPSAISFSSTAPSASTLAISAGASQSFSFALMNPSGIATGASWIVNGVNQTGSFNQNAFSANSVVAGVHNITLKISSSQNTLTKSWTLTATATPPTNSTPLVTDLNGDRVVDLFDIMAVIRDLGKTY